MDGLLRGGHRYITKESKNSHPESHQSSLTSSSRSSSTEDQGLRASSWRHWSVSLAAPTTWNFGSSRTAMVWWRHCCQSNKCGGIDRRPLFCRRRRNNHQANNIRPEWCTVAVERRVLMQVVRQFHSPGRDYALRDLRAITLSVRLYYIECLSRNFIMFLYLNLYYFKLDLQHSIVQHRW